MSKPHGNIKKRQSWASSLRSNFLTGLIIIAPITLTAWLMWSVVGWIDSRVWSIVPDTYQPHRYVQTLYNIQLNDQIDIRGVGLVVFLAFTIFVGWLGKGFVGRSLLRYGESLVERMPVVRTVYGSVKQIAETVFNQKNSSFDKACLIEYPRKGIWAIGFIATGARGEIEKYSPKDDHLVSVFVPTTPNPTSGFMLFLPSKDINELAMSVEEAAKLVISAGLVYPAEKE
ncbi:MAG: DUF502 domain-containing protein [Planktomarina sp.]|jgi:uncharacterized membrane protein|nr:DUF502 domain-containing protein [Planktomarina sp.]MDC1530985.1 DUF502 domain-containing protein [bacterium]MDC3385744.1 DUF502 domain-containing protein [Planktomarina sp.]MDS9950263.1 DUF502 domain-containing protein [Planktomarina sp.]|tara:strand:+ start:567 stop:1253 length:687 start_codon:yes stop_codon:yes gene_type:complete